ncbi:MAG: cysteine desulfurase family protein [Verrucomicrobiota bacterium]|nr:cysteine desulfurase family protein [Verrucomicrobiota bacterium]
MQPIYFDYNATTPLDRGVKEAMIPYLDTIFGNPSSVHQLGRDARVALDSARERCARVLGSKASEVVFTSGGTESNNLAIFGVVRLLEGRGRHLITSPTEHHSVLHCFQYLARNGFDVTYLNVDANGRVDPVQVAESIRKETILVSVMAANNETGMIQPVPEIGAICRQKGVLFHTDASQFFGKEPFASICQFNADLVTVCAHKFHGPKGAGALFIKSPLLPHPLLFGGGHENERRAGTENLAAILGLTMALEQFVRDPVFPAERLRKFAEQLREATESVPGTQVISSNKSGLANTLSFLVEGCDSIALMAGLDLEGVCASSGSACSAGSLEPSHVVSAMGYPRHLANALVRFSLGRENTRTEVERVAELLPIVIKRLRN